MQNSDIFSISRMCDVLNVSRSSFYHYFYYSNDNSDQKTDILCRILSIYYNSNRTYGAPRIAAVLNKEGCNISTKTVGKYMRLLEIQSISYSKFPKHNFGLSDYEKSLIINLIKDLDITNLNQVWTTDITYIKTKQDGWVYLSSIMDLYSRKIISWNVDLNMKKEFVMLTLKNAFKSRGYPTNVIIHSDKGSQYRSYAFRKMVIKHKCLYSYTSIDHSCDENANQESFHASLKKECIYQHSFNTIEDVKRAVFEYIEGFYNTSRIHSSIGNCSPNEFENTLLSSNPPLVTV